MKRDPSNSTFPVPAPARALVATVNHLTVNTPECLAKWQCESGDKVPSPQLAPRGHVESRAKGLLFPLLFFPHSSAHFEEVSPASQ